jgi:hypothetical protein
LQHILRLVAIPDLCDDKDATSDGLRRSASRIVKDAAVSNADAADDDDLSRHSPEYNPSESTV